LYQNIVGCRKAGDGAASGETRTLASGADCLRYHSGQDFLLISQYRLIDSSPS